MVERRAAASGDRAGAVDAAGLHIPRRGHPLRIRHPRGRQPPRGDTRRNRCHRRRFRQCREHAHRRLHAAHRIAHRADTGQWRRRGVRRAHPRQAGSLVRKGQRARTARARRAARHGDGPAPLHREQRLDPDRGNALPPVDRQARRPAREACLYRRQLERAVECSHTAQRLGGVRGGAARRPGRGGRFRGGAGIRRVQFLCARRRAGRVRRHPVGTGLRSDAPCRAARNAARRRGRADGGRERVRGAGRGWRAPAGR